MSNIPSSHSPRHEIVLPHTHGRFTADKITKKPTKELNHRPQPRSMKFLRVNRSPFHSALRLLSCSAPTSKMFWWFYNIQHWLLATAWFALMSGWRALQSSPTSTLLSKILEIIFLKNDGSVCWHGGSEGSRSNFRAAQPRRHAYHVTFSEGATRDWSLLTAPVTTVRHTRRKYFSLFILFFGGGILILDDLLKSRWPRCCCWWNNVHQPPAGDPFPVMSTSRLSLHAALLCDAHVAAKKRREKKWWLGCSSFWLWLDSSH